MVRQALVPIGVLVSLLAALAAGPPTPAQPVPSGDLPKPLVIPEKEKNRQNPVPNVPEAIESGKSLYGSQCAMCHGARGDGKGDVAVAVKMTMPSFADPKVQAKRTDGELFYIMTQGHGDMPGEKRLVDQNKWEIVRYLRTLSKADAPAPAAKK
jgi:mono/diheme cytochrome c family protein